jgi:hypothetical protein
LDKPSPSGAWERDEIINSQSPGGIGRASLFNALRIFKLEAFLKENLVDMKI